MKNFIFLLLVWSSFRVFAQDIKIKTEGQIIHIGTSKDTIIRFFDAESDFLATKDKSYYYRQVYPVENEPRRLYRVQAFYTDTNLPKFYGHRYYNKKQILFHLFFSNSLLTLFFMRKHIVIVHLLCLPCVVLA
ncbi:hypothetical protein, partial [Sphingobacterium sp. 18053]|uniref:hypothetical protein n=1 Tax=Sphingobacterium sp. 18053 TaxID=2681401 RepID=UPI001F357355